MTKLKLNPTSQEIAADAVLAALVEAEAEARDRMRTHREGQGWRGMPVNVATSLLDMVSRLRLGWQLADEEIDRLAASLTALQAAGVDPLRLRWCAWPDCWKSYDAVPGPVGDPGWIRGDRSNNLLLCRHHASAGHKPSVTTHWEPPKLLVGCECGSKADLGGHAALQEAYAWWRFHVRGIEVQPVRRSWLFGDPEPPAGTLVLVAEQVWMHHEQLRWILWPGGNGCPGIGWDQLNDNPHFPVVEVFPHQQIDNLSRLIIPATTAAKGGKR